MALDRRAGRLLAMLAATEGAPQALETPAARRQALRSLAEMADDSRAAADVRDLRCRGPGGEIGLRAYAPPGAGQMILPGLVFLHGGGWVAGDLVTHDGLCRRLALAADARVIAVDYRRGERMFGPPNIRSPRRSRMRSPLCGGSRRTPGRSASTRRGWRSAAIRPAAASPRR
jgi:hypothetical protein